MLTKFDNLDTLNKILDEIEKSDGEEFLKDHLTRRNKGGETLMHIAIRNDSTNCLKKIAQTLPSLLLDSMSYDPIDLPDIINDQDELNSIQFAASLNKPAIIDLFLSKDFWKLVQKDAPADGSRNAQIESAESYIKTLTKNGWTVLHLAAAAGAKEALTYLLEKSNVENLLAERGGNGSMTCLHLAALKGYKKICKMLIGHTKSLKLDESKYKRDLLNWPRDELEQTTLMHACQSGDVATVTFIMNEWKKSKFDIDKNGQTPLHHLCIHGKRGWNVIMDLLVEDNKGILKIKDKDDNTALHCLAKKEHPYTENMCKKLLEREDSLQNMGSKEGVPLQIAIQENNIDAIKGLTSIWREPDEEKIPNYSQRCDIFKAVKGYFERYPKPSWDLIELLLESLYNKHDYSKMFQDEDSHLARLFKALMVCNFSHVPCLSFLF